MKITHWLGVGLLTLLGALSIAHGQQITTPSITASGCAYNASPPTITTGNFALVQCDSAGSLRVAGTINASLTGFRPTAFGTPVSATNVSSTQTLPAGTQVVATNISTTVAAYCALGATATTSSQYIPPSSWFGFAIDGDTQISCITASSTATINTAGGTGLPTGANGGSGSGGGGGAATIADGADVAEGATTDAAATQGSTGSVSAKLRTVTAQLNTLAGNTTGLATAAKQPALGTAGTASADVISVQGIASGTALGISAASLPLPALAATSTKQSDGSQKSQIVDGSGNVIAATSNALNVQCANCSGSGVSTTDAASFTAGASLFAGGGGFFQTTATSNALTSGQQGLFQVTANRALFTNLRNVAGAEVGVAAVPLQVSLANTAANATAVKVDGSAVTQPVSGTVTTTPPSNASTNVAQVAGTTTDTNSGVKSAGTLRVVLATDQPQLTNKLLVTPDSVALPANQSVNVSQINAVTPLMGNGTTGTGSQRVTIASDNSAVTGMGVGATGAAVPANAVLIGLNVGGNTTAPVGDPCQVNAHTTTPISINAASTTIVVAGTSAKKTYICGMMLFSAGTTNVGIVQGSGSTCGTSTLGLIGGTTAATGPNLTAQSGFVVPTGGYASAATTVNANDVCLINSQAIQVSGFIVTAVQ